MTSFPDSKPVATPTPWARALGRRALALWPLKLIGNTLATIGFFPLYFWVMRHSGEAWVLPLTPIDRLVAFWPALLPVYLSLWLYVGVAPGLQPNFRELLVYGFWVGGLCLTGLGLFYLWPTQIPPLAIDVSGYAGFEMLQGVNAAGNACPSMHVAVAIFTAVRLEHVLREARTPLWPRLLNWLWFAAIAWSTLAVKQHVALDALAGAVLGLAFALPSLRWRPGYRAR